MMSDHARSDRHPGMEKPAPRGPRRLLPRRLITKGRLLAGLACVFGGAIVVNAVVLQNEKHPSPLFRTVAKAPEIFPVPPMRPESNPAVRSAAFVPAPMNAAKPAPADKSKPAPQVAVAPTPDTGDVLMAEIQRELGKRGYYKGDADGKAGPMTTQAIRDFQFAQRIAVDGKPSEALLRDVQASKVTMKDELLDLVKRTASAEDKTTRTIADVQRALNKAGYGPLVADGQMGPSTKQALAKFEADKKLPPRGEPKGPVLKVLASASGIPISQ
jgi:peptidoglycan hydrolase-like protein with peptidoglycan-binding domain